jgi:hypothetical protein
MAALLRCAVELSSRFQAVSVRKALKLTISDALLAGFRKIVWPTAFWGEKGYG